MVIFFKILSADVSLSFYLKNGLLSSLNYSFFIFEKHNTLKFHSCQIFLKNCQLKDKTGLFFNDLKDKSGLTWKGKKDVI